VFDWDEYFQKAALDRAMRLLKEQPNGEREVAGRLEMAEEMTLSTWQRALRTRITMNDVWKVWIERRPMTT
jgi:hypothetical protein